MSHWDHDPSNIKDNNSLAAVVYGMVQARKKTALGSSFSVATKQQHPISGGTKTQVSASNSLSTPPPTSNLSVTFSLRRKTKKTDHKLQRIASEKPGRKSKQHLFDVLNTRRNVVSVSLKDIVILLLRFGDRGLDC